MAAPFRGGLPEQRTLGDGAGRGSGLHVGMTLEGSGERRVMPWAQGVEMAGWGADSPRVRRGLRVGCGWGIGTG